jgi:hypothetical protein
MLTDGCAHSCAGAVLRTAARVLTGEPERSGGAAVGDWMDQEFGYIEGARAAAPVVRHVLARDPRLSALTEDERAAHLKSANSALKWAPKDAGHHEVYGDGFGVGFCDGVRLAVRMVAGAMRKRGAPLGTIEAVEGIAASLDGHHYPLLAPPHARAEPSAPRYRLDHRLLLGPRPGALVTGPALVHLNNADGDWFFALVDEIGYQPGGAGFGQLLIGGAYDHPSMFPEVRGDLRPDPVTGEVQFRSASGSFYTIRPLLQPDGLWVCGTPAPVTVLSRLDRVGGSGVPLVRLDFEVFAGVDPDNNTVVGLGLADTSGLYARGQGMWWQVADDDLRFDGMEWIEVRPEFVPRYDSLTATTPARLLHRDDIMPFAKESDAATRVVADLGLKLGWYVYLLLDPRDSHVFYIGVGEGNRVQEHVAVIADRWRAGHDAPNEGWGDDDPSSSLEAFAAERIVQILDAGQVVAHRYLRHGLESERHARDVAEAALDLLGLTDIDTDLVHSARQKEPGPRGLLSLSETAVLYLTPPAPALDQPLLLIRPRVAWTPRVSDAELYEATRGWWTLGPEREQARYALAVCDGVIRGVYRINNWRTRDTDDERPNTVDPVAPHEELWSFAGGPAPELAHLMHHSVTREGLPYERVPAVIVNGT